MQDKLKQFIDKYHLNGTIETVKWTINPDSLSTNFVTEDKTLTGNATLNSNLGLETCELGVYQTTMLLKLLNVFDSPITCALTKTPIGTYDSMTMVCGTTKVKYKLADLSVIPVAPKLKGLPDTFDLVIPVDDSFRSKFQVAKNSLSDISHITFNVNEAGNLEMIAGYSKNDTTRITYVIPGQINTAISNMSFNSNHILSILKNNTDATVTINIFNGGLCNITCVGKDYTANYYLVMINHN